MVIYIKLIEFTINGTGGGGGKASLDEILLLRVGVLAFDAFGVLPVDGGAGGG